MSKTPPLTTPPAELSVSSNAEPLLHACPWCLKPHAGRFVLCDEDNELAHRINTRQGR
jgi:hypothetical protein